MAYRPDDPYNTGINTIGTDLGLGNINQGQNMQTAGVWGNIMPEFMGGYSKEEMARNAALEQIEGLRINQMKGIPTAKDPVGQKEIIDNLQYTNPDKLKQYQDYEKQIEELKKQYPGDVNIQGAYLDDDKTPYDFSDIEGQTAMINPLSIIGLVKAGLSKKEIAKVLMKNKLQKEIGKKVKPVLTGILTGGKAAAAAPTSHKEAQATGGDYHSDTRSTVDGQTTDWGDELFSRGGLAQHAPRYANGGLIDFFRYGGFIG